MTLVLSDTDVNMTQAVNEEENEIPPLHIAIIKGILKPIWKLLMKGESVDLSASNPVWKGSANPFELLFQRRKKYTPSVYTVMLLMLLKFTDRNCAVIMRHSQSELNYALLHKLDHSGIYDAGITKDGEAEARYINKWVRRCGLLDGYHIIVSPLRRVLDTVEIVTNDIKTSPVANHLLRERLNHTACIGRPVSELKTKYSNCDFSSVPEKWWFNPEKNDQFTTDVTEESENDMKERIKIFYNNPLKLGKTLIVAHGGIINSIFQNKLRARNCDAFIVV